MEDLIRLLHEGGYSLIVANGEVDSFTGRGVSDLYKILNEDPGYLVGASVADKVVGKAAAALMILGRIKELYADVISVPANTLLKESGIKVSYRTEVPHIINRAGTGWCPLETLCYELQSPQECFVRIREFMNKKQ